MTFTEASAQDMRQKLKKQLSEQLGERFSYVELQAAAIGTFHGFCANIVRSWFTVADVSPSFTVMDTIESEKLKSTVFEKVVLNHYEKVKDAVDLFTASRSLDELRKIIFKLHNFLETRHDKMDWIKNTALTVYHPVINENPAVRALMEYYQNLAKKYRQFFIEMNHISPQVDFVIDVTNQIIQAKNYEDFQKLNFEFVRATKERNFILYDTFIKLRTGLRKVIKRLNIKNWI